MNGEEDGIMEVKREPHPDEGEESPIEPVEAYSDSAPFVAPNADSCAEVIPAVVAGDELLQSVSVNDVTSLNEFEEEEVEFEGVDCGPKEVDQQQQEPIHCDAVLQDADTIKKEGNAEALEAKIIMGVEEVSGIELGVENMEGEEEDEEDEMEVEEVKKIEEEVLEEMHVEVKEIQMEEEDREVEKDPEEENPDEEEVLEEMHVEAKEIQMEEEEEEEEREVEKDPEEEEPDEEEEREAGKDLEEEVPEEEDEMEEEDLEEEEPDEEEEREIENDPEEEVPDEDKEEEEDMDIKEAPSTTIIRKSKRGRNTDGVNKAPPRKTGAEDVCFTCFDGGDLVLCSRRGCPKAYHPSCVDHDEDLIRSKSRWTCGSHLCTQCKKNACVMCYTCQFSLCKGCLKGNGIFTSVRGNKGLCKTCMKNVLLIENSKGEDIMDQAAADDKSIKLHLYKDYWTEQKEIFSLTSDELSHAINQWESSNADNDAETTDCKRNKSKKRRFSSKKIDTDVGSIAEASGSKKKGMRHLKSQTNLADSDSDDTSKDQDGIVPRGRKTSKASKARALEVNSAAFGGSINKGTPSRSGTEWASKELLEFVVLMKHGDKYPLSQFDVQELLLEYIQRNKLRDPRRKSHIICDAMLQKLFGKPRVGHFEMLKLLELHFLLKEDSQPDDNQGSVVDAEGSQFDADENADSLVDVGKYRGKKARKKGDGRGLQSNLDDYAAIDIHNITLIYLRRNLIEALLEDSESLHGKVVGSFVRIRIPGNNQKQDIYRLVQVIGTNTVEPYKVGKKIAYCMLEILNLNKTEVVSIDTISNQDFTEDECKRLRQSIKCGLIGRLTVGDVLNKAKDLQAVSVNDWLETEITRLNHLRDRASDMGHKKELRECVEKLQRLSTPEERQRRLEEIPKVHADPKMDPSHESEDESEPDEKGQDSIVTPRETHSLWREREHYTSRKGDATSTDPWTPTSKPPTRRWESSRGLSGKGLSNRMEDSSVAENAMSGSPWSPVREKMSSKSTSLETFRTAPDSLTGKLGQFSERNPTTKYASPQSEAPQHPSAALTQTVKNSDTEKLWHYKDPSGKVQGPFSVAQLRKWNKSGYFPESMGIWRTSQSEHDSISVTDALTGRFEKGPSQQSEQIYRGQATNVPKLDQSYGAGYTRDSTDQVSPMIQRSRSVDPSKFSYNDSANQPSTPLQSTSLGSTGRSKASRWSGSPTPIQLPDAATGPTSVPLANGMLPSPTPISGRVAGSSTSSSFEQNRGFSRSQPIQQSTRDAVSFPRSREDERSAYAHDFTSQSAPAAGSPMAHTTTHQTLQPVNDSIAANSTNTNYSYNSAIEPGNGQNPAASAHTWGYMPRSETPNNFNNTNGMQMQGQQPTYSHWPANNLPPPPPTYSAGHPANHRNDSAQNSAVPMPSQAVWTPQAPTAAQPGMQWVGMPTVQHPHGNSNAGWGHVQQNTNMGWGATPGPSPAGQFNPQPGQVAPASYQASGPSHFGNSNMNWRAAGNVNQGWAAGPDPWKGQPSHHGGNRMAPSGGRMCSKTETPCPFLLQGRCKKGANCDYRHS